MTPLRRTRLFELLRQNKKPLCLAGALIALLPGICVFIYLFFGFDESLLRIDTPAANPKEAGIVDPELPSSATNIYFLYFAGGLQDLERFVRFTVSPDTVDHVVEDLIRANNRQFKHSLSYPRSPLSSAPPVSPRPQFLPMTWWTPSDIKTGYYRGAGLTGYSLRIWADTITGTVFIYQND